MGEGLTMNPTDPDSNFRNDVEKYAATPDFLKGVDLGPSTLEGHRATPEVSYEQYRSKKELEWADIVMSRKSVYLDTRFWISLRDADLGRPVPSIYGQLLRELRRGVAHGEIICPFAADMLAEVYNQSDQTTRLATAQLIDELSLNVALQSEPERLTTELHHGIQAIRSSAPPQEPLRKLVWTCPSFVIGHLKASSTAFDAATELAAACTQVERIAELRLIEKMG